MAAVTGAGSGIGRGLALRLAAEGCELALSDWDEEGLAETCEQAAPRALKLTHRKLDVRDREDVYAWADEVVRDHERVHLIVNNAGVALGAQIVNMTLEELEWVMDIDFWGVVHGTKAFLPHLEASGEGHVVNISSVFGLIAAPGNGAYNAAKFAVRGFTEALRIELEATRSCVSATSVHPGGIRTNIARKARTGEAEAGVDRDALAEQFDRVARTSPDEAARVILDGVVRNRRRVLIGGDARFISALQRLLPNRYQALLAWAMRRSDTPLV